MLPIPDPAPVRGALACLPGPGRLLLVVACALALACASCGRKARLPTHPVEGKVFWKDTTTPATGAHIIFHPVGETNPDHWPQGYPHGQVGADGAFHLTTYAEGDGAPAGRYAILVHWPRRAEGEEEGGEEGEDALQGSYQDPRAPRFEAEVREGGNNLKDFTFVLR